MKIEEKIIREALEKAIQSNPANALTLIQIYRHLEEMDALEKINKDNIFKPVYVDKTNIEEQLESLGWFEKSEKAIDSYVAQQLDFGIETYEMLDFIESYQQQGLNYILAYINTYGENQLDRMKLTLKRNNMSLNIHHNIALELINEVVEVIQMRQDQLKNKGEI